MPPDNIDETNMYGDLREKIEETVEIDGYPFYAEEISAEESYNRRETNRQSILGGTEYVTRGKYITRQFSFTTYIYFPTGHPEQYDAIFQEMVSKPCEVISKYMGGKFNAEVTVQKTAEESSPNTLKLDIEVVEIPEMDSLIPGDGIDTTGLQTYVQTETNTNQQ